MGNSKHICDLSDHIRLLISPYAKLVSVLMFLSLVCSPVANFTNGGDFHIAYCNFVGVLILSDVLYLYCA